MGKDSDRRRVLHVEHTVGVDAPRPGDPIGEGDPDRRADVVGEVQVEPAVSLGKPVRRLDDARPVDVEHVVVVRYVWRRRADQLVSHVHRGDRTRRGGAESEQPPTELIDPERFRQGLCGRNSLN